MFKLILVHIFAALIMSIPSLSYAFDYDVDWPTSKGNLHYLRITIEGCTTVVSVKTEDLEKFKNSDEALQTQIKRAIKRSKNGCQN